ncbi:MAG TPA: rod shape-determining protein MreD [Pyrinomonadaceae bacterium]|jgi:rod shape-determining protein MreD|nr:rod shape-determining protein MreD [Pyrinomonadaceae bacterium]
MEGVKLTVALIIAILLQWTLRNVWPPLTFIDFPLIIVVYAALQRNSIRAILFGTISGISMDALSGGLLGANGFSKTLVAYAISEITRRVYMDNLILRIPVIAGACFVNDLVYYGLHRLFGQTPAGDPVTTIAYSVIGTTVAGTLIYLLFQNFSGDRARARTQKRREVFAPRRQTRRRNPIRLGK